MHIKILYTYVKEAQLYRVKKKKKEDENIYSHKQLKGSTSHFQMPKK